MGFRIEGGGARAVVTGASTDIGAAYARRLAAHGWDLTLVARRGGRLTALADDLRAASGSRDVQAIIADLARPEDVERVGHQVAGDDVALLVNDAGVHGYGPFPQMDPALARRVLGVNVVAPTALTRAALPGMLARGRGAVVNVAPLLAFAGTLAPDAEAYAEAKGYLVTFTRTLAAELGSESPVRAQVVCPGLTAAEFLLTAGTGEDVVTASLDGLVRGEVVCAPGLTEPAALTRLSALQAPASSPVAGPAHAADAGGEAGRT